MRGVIVPCAIPQCLVWEPALEAFTVRVHVPLLLKRTNGCD
jgi:hypothetical protein